MGKTRHSFFKAEERIAGVMVNPIVYMDGDQVGCKRENLAKGMLARLWVTESQRAIKEKPHSDKVTI